MDDHNTESLTQASVMFMYIHAKLVGSIVETLLTNGTVIEGVLHSFKLTGRDGLSVALGMARRLRMPDGSAPPKDGHAFYDRLVISGKDFGEMRAKNISEQDYNAKGPQSPGATGGFQTDVEVSKSGFTGRERKLQKWEPDEIPGGGIDDAMPSTYEINGGWDQFEVNETKFGLKTDYNEEFYTTRLDRDSDDYRKKEKEAQRLAREIESESTDNRHLMEERNQKLESGEDEEARYSSVNAVNRQQNQRHSTSATGRYGVHPLPHGAAATGSVGYRRSDRTNMAMRYDQPRASPATNYRRPNPHSPALPSAATTGAATSQSNNALAASGSQQSQRLPPKLSETARSETQLGPRGKAGRDGAIQHLLALDSELKKAAMEQVTKRFQEFAYAEKNRMGKMRQEFKTTSIQELKEFSKNFTLKIGSGKPKLELDENAKKAAVQAVQKKVAQRLDSKDTTRSAAATPTPGSKPTTSNTTPSSTKSSTPESTPKSSHSQKGGSKRPPPPGQNVPKSAHQVSKAAANRTISPTQTPTTSAPKVTFERKEPKLRPATKDSWHIPVDEKESPPSAEPSPIETKATSPTKTESDKPEVKETKETKEVKDTKEVKQPKEHREPKKEPIEHKPSEEQKDLKESKGSFNFNASEFVPRSFKSKAKTTPETHPQSDQNVPPANVSPEKGFRGPPTSGPMVPGPVAEIPFARDQYYGMQYQQQYYPYQQYQMYPRGFPPTTAVATGQGMVGAPPFAQPFTAMPVYPPEPPQLMAAGPPPFPIMPMQTPHHGYQQQQRPQMMGYYQQPGMGVQQPVAPWMGARMPQGAPPPQGTVARVPLGADMQLQPGQMAPPRQQQMPPGPHPGMIPPMPEGFPAQQVAMSPPMPPGAVAAGPIAVAPHTPQGMTTPPATNATPPIGVVLPPPPRTEGAQ